MKKDPSGPAKSMLVITVGFIAVYLFTRWEWPVYLALAVGLAGVVSDNLSKKIELLWMKLSWVLSLIVPNILLSLVFFLILWPLALLSRLLRKEDPLLLKNEKDSTFREVDKTFNKTSLGKTW